MKQLNLHYKTKKNIENNNYNESIYFINQTNKLQHSSLFSNLDPCSIVYGPKFSGKTHLAHLWKKNNNAIFLEIPQREILLSQSCILENFNLNINKYEEEILHCFNTAKENNNKLLLTTSIPLLKIDFKIPDLKSRLIASNYINLNHLDDEILKIVIAKEFYLRQLKIEKNIINYIIKTTERSYEAILKIINFIDNLSLAQKKNITLKFISKILKTHYQE